MTPFYEQPAINQRTVQRVMDMSDQQAIDQYLASHKVTKCPPAVAQGAGCGQLVRQDVNQRRRAYRNTRTLTVVE